MGGRFDKNGDKLIINKKRKGGTFWGYQIEIDPTSRAWSGAIYEEAGRGFLHTPGVNETVKVPLSRLSGIILRLG